MVHRRQPKLSDLEACVFSLVSVRQSAEALGGLPPMAYITPQAEWFHAEKTSPEN